MKRFAALLVVIFLSGAGQSFADVKLPAIFGGHMVVQSGMKIPIWGWGDVGEKVTVKVGEQSKSATTNDKGRWRVTLDEIKSADPVEISISGKNSITIHDVLVGQVWLCSGQSNMGFELHTAANAKDAIAAADHPKMRLFTVEHALNDDVQDDVKGKWEICTPQTVPDFSAVGYFFGLALHQKLNEPIGLIHSSWGGTRAEAWMPKNVFDDLKLPYEPEWTESWLHPQPTTATTNPVVRPQEGPAVLYNAMIAPIAQYAMKGAIWYQGETNTAHGEQYHDVLAAMIKSWRRAWGEGDFPFLIVQISSLTAQKRDWSITREAQTEVARDLPNCGLVVTIDVGNPHNIHPTDKQTVGDRLALQAEKIAYGQKVMASGPVYRRVEIRGDQVMISFSNAQGGLVSKSNALTKVNDDEVLGFEIAGDDGKFVPADAKIQGRFVIVSADSVPSPKTVRYAWKNAPQCSLYNKEGLPAVPFDSSK